MADSFLARELVTETNHEILRHLDACPVCRADVAGRRALREGVRRAFQNARELGPTAEFTTRLRTTLEKAARSDRARRNARFHGWWALAAAALLAVALGLAYRGRDRITPTGALVRAAVGDHRDCALQFRLAETPVSLKEAAGRYGPAYRVLETLPPDHVMTRGGPARVLERHACVFKGRRFAHIVFEYRGKHVSLMVTTAERGVERSVPAKAPPRVTSAGPIDGLSAAYFRTPREIVFLVGDVAQADLVELADAVAGPLSRELAGT